MDVYRSGSVLMASPQLRFTEKSDEVKPRAAQQQSVAPNMDGWLTVELVTAYLLTHTQSVWV